MKRHRSTNRSTSGGAGTGSLSARGATTISYLVILGVLAALILIAVLIGRDSGPGEAPATGSRSDLPELAGSRLLDPTPYRDHIEALELVLYRQEPADAATADHVVFAARRLANAVRSTEGELAGGRASRELLALAAEIEQRDDAETVPIDLVETRARWSRLRKRLFDHADWFAGTGAVSKRAAPATDASFADRLKELADRTEELIAAGRQETGEFADIGVDVPGDSFEADQLRSDWLRWKRQWERRVSALSSALPPQSTTDAPSELVAARVALARAIYDLRLVPTNVGDTEIPPRDQRERRFAAAEAAAAEARGQLEGFDEQSP